MEHPSTAETLRTFFADEVIEGPAVGLTMDTPLLEWGLLTSLSTMRLLSFITQRFGVEVPEHEVVGSNLKDLNSIALLVDRLLQSRPSVPDQASAEAGLAGLGTGRNAGDAAGGGTVQG